MGVIDEPAMHRLLQAIAVQNQQQNLELLHPQQQHTDILAALARVAQNPLQPQNLANKVPCAKNLP